MRLYVNIDHVATVRQARLTDEPDPVHAALLAELGGADGITVHLREDLRHIQDRDVGLLMQTVRTGINLEAAITEEMIGIACELRPMQVTLVPERREEVTTEGGLDVAGRGVRASVSAAIERLRASAIRTSLFLDPSEAALRTAAEIGVEAVELHTGEYANAGAGEAKVRELDRLRMAAELGAGLGLTVHAGHGLTYRNVLPVAALPGIEELNIGHSIVSRAVLVGMEEAVREMGRIIRGAPTRVREPGRWIPPIGY
jgi:pyridoxine 5-phosphate synthase